MSNRRVFFEQAVACMVAAASAKISQAGVTDVPGKLATPAQSLLKTYTVPNTDLVTSRFGFGAPYGGEFDDQPFTDANVRDAQRLIHAAFDNGITLFDTADIYAYGKSELAMGEVLKRSPSLRNKIVLQSKCGIYIARPIASPPLNDPHRFDFSYQRITSAVEGSLNRLKTDRLDILLLHRPDALVEPQEVARAFDDLHERDQPF